jgi:hypothetical protein
LAGNEDWLFLLNDIETGGVPIDPENKGWASLQAQAREKYRLLHGQGSFDELAVLLWTMDKQLNLPEVYKSANEALLCDVYEDLQRFGGFMASVNRYIKTHPAPRLISLFRGTKIRQEQHVGPEQLEASEASAGIFRQPIYAGASEKESIAAEFGKQEGSPIIQYIVPAGCRRCTVLPAQLSAYPRHQVG